MTDILKVFERLHQAWQNATWDVKLLLFQIAMRILYGQIYVDIKRI